MPACVRALGLEKVSVFCSRSKRIATKKTSLFGVFFEKAAGLRTELFRLHSCRGFSYHADDRFGVTGPDMQPTIRPVQPQPVEPVDRRVPPAPFECGFQPP